MIKKMNSIALSLSGICQSAYLVQQLAQLGECDNYAFKVCLKSILKINSTSVIEVYGNHEKNLNIGLKTLLSILTFSNLSPSCIEMIKYIFNMIIIEKKLKKNYLATSSLQQRILSISKEYDMNYDFDFVINELEILYLEVISSLGSRVEIKGTKLFLQDLKIQKKIRCLLFSGIRSIVLWKQFGGNPLKLMFFRYYIIKKTKKILYNLKNNT